MKTNPKKVEAFLKAWDLFDEGFDKIEISKEFGVTAYKFEGDKVVEMKEFPKLNWSEERDGQEKNS